MFAILLGVIGFRRTPRLTDQEIDFHLLPWLIGLVSICWYKYFYKKDLLFSNTLFVILLLPLLVYFSNQKTYFPTKESAGKMVIRYADGNKIVRYLVDNKSDTDTLLTLPAHTLLYRQTKIKPFNKFLFYLPWMEQSPILFSKLSKSFEDSLPTYIFIDSINFPYTPPKLISNILHNYNKIQILENQPPFYRLKIK